MAETLVENTNLRLLFPVIEPSSYNEINDVAQRTMVYPGERILVALSLEYVDRKGCEDHKKLWRSSVQKLHITSSNIACFRNKVGQPASTGMDTREILFGSGANPNSSYTGKNNQNCSREQIMDKYFKLCQPFASYSDGNNCDSSRRRRRSNDNVVSANVVGLLWYTGSAVLLSPFLFFFF